MGSTSEDPLNAVQRHRLRSDHQLFSITAVLDRRKRSFRVFKLRK